MGSEESARPKRESKMIGCSRMRARDVGNWKVLFLGKSIAIDFHLVY